MNYDNGDPVVINNKHHPWYGLAPIVIGGFCPIGGETTLVVQLGTKREFVLQSQVRRYREMDKKVPWNDILWIPEGV